MGVQRRVNWVSQQRVDVPDMRAVESAASNDFDQLMKAAFTGTAQGYFERGFEINMTGAINSAAKNLQVIVDPGAVLHIAASESGTFMLVPPGTPNETLDSSTNSIVDGAFTPNAINYVGLDYERFIDPATSSQIYLWDPSTNSETTKTAPRAQILRYRLKVSTSSWPSNVLPIAIITTDAGNNVSKISDSRWLMNRLGQGGSSPNPLYRYPWTKQSEGRTESPSTSSSNSINPFRGGDKMLGWDKEWKDAVMTKLLELGGTPYWYSFGAAGSIDKLREDAVNTISSGKGTITHSADVAGQMTWTDDYFYKVVGTQLVYKIVANPSSSYITLADGQVAYITLQRDISITPNLIYTYDSMSNTTIVTVVGGLTAWTAPLSPGDFLRSFADTDPFYTKIKSVDSPQQVTLFGNYVPTGMSDSGLQSVYALGTYQAAASPSLNTDIFITDRTLVPTGQNVFWLFDREDNGAVIPRVYARFLGAQMEQGDTDEIDDEVPRQMLQYIGAPLESSAFPQYVQAVSPGAVTEITDITLGNAASITSGSYFFINSSGDNRKYYFWFNKDGTGTDPNPNADCIAVEVDITTGQTNVQVAAALNAAFNTTLFPDFISVQHANPNQFILRVTLTSAGSTADALNGTVGAPFAITNFQQGTGLGNAIIRDRDNLTLAIKELDEEFARILSNANNPNYDEPLFIISGSASDSNELTGPILAGTNIVLPLNSRQGETSQLYTTGKGKLVVLLNGQALNLGTTGSSAPSALIAYGMSGATFAQATLTGGVTSWAVKYTPTTNTNLVTMKLKVSTGSGACIGNLFGKVFNSAGTTPGVTQIGSSSNPLLASTLGVSVQTISLTFPVAVPLVAFTDYWFTISGDAAYNAGTATDHVTLQGPNGGQVFPVDFFQSSAWHTTVGNTYSFELDASTSLSLETLDWNEVGAPNTHSNQITINQNLVVGDLLTFRIGGGGGSGAAIGPPGPIGPQGPAGANAAGGPVAISTKVSNYTVLSSDCFLMANCTTVPITFTLPTAGSVIGKIFYFKKVDSTSNAMTILASGGALIDGFSTLSTASQYDEFALISDGTNWWIF